MALIGSNTCQFFRSNEIAESSFPCLLETSSSLLLFLIKDKGIKIRLNDPVYLFPAILIIVIPGEDPESRGRRNQASRIVSFLAQTRNPGSVTKSFISTSRLFSTLSFRVKPRHPGACHFWLEQESRGRQHRKTA